MLLKRKLKKRILVTLQILFALVSTGSFFGYVYYYLIKKDDSLSSLLILCLSFSVFYHLTVNILSRYKNEDLKLVNDEISSKLKQYTFLKLDKHLISSIRQYLVFFSNYVKDSKKVDITMHASEVEGGLDIAFDFPETTTKEELQTWLDEYLGFLTTDKDNFQLNTVDEVSHEEADILILRLRNQVQSFRHSIDILKLENKLLKSQNEQIMDITKLLASKGNQFFVSAAETKQ